MIGLPTGTRIWLAAGITDMRRGFDGLASIVQAHLSADPFGGHVFVFRGRRGDLVKLLWWDGDGLCLFAKRLERGRFIWPNATEGSVHLSGAQLSMLLGAATEFGNNRTLGVCHVARRSFECPSSQSDFSKPAARLTFH